MDFPLSYFAESILLLAMRLRTIFMGTPQLAAVSLEALLRSPDIDLVAVVTQPDQPKGRGLKLQASPVKEIALRSNLPVLQPARARDEKHIEELRALNPELVVVAAYGQILPKATLEIPRHGCINVHTSLLPKYRGAAPIQWAVLNGDAITGVTIMKMDVGMDTGPIIATAETPIDSSDNAETLHDRLAVLGAELLVKTIPDYASGKVGPRPQPVEGMSHAPKIRKQDGLIDWKQPAQSVWNRIRAMVPWPGAFTHLASDPKPELLKIFQAEVLQESGRAGEVLRASKTGIVIGCGQGALNVAMLQPEGSRRMTASEFLAGHPMKPGQVLG